MGIFRNVEELRKSSASMAVRLIELEKRLAEIEAKLPDYEEAVARGVDDVWNKALTDVANYDPMAFMKKGASDE